MDAARQLLLLGTTAWSPASISGLTSWHRADKDLFQSNGLTGPATADGDPVGGWVDQTGNGNHLQQGTGASRPILKLGVINGRNAVRFDGTDDYMLRNVQQTQGYTFAAVMRFSSVAGLIYLWHNGDAGTGHEFLSNANQLFIQNTSVGNQSDGAPGSDVAVWVVRRNVADGTSLRKDAANVALVGAEPAMNLPLTLMHIGSYTGGLFPFPGDLAELCIWNRRLTDAEVALVETYLNLRWAAY